MEWDDLLRCRWYTITYPDANGNRNAYDSGDGNSHAKGDTDTAASR